MTRLRVVLAAVAVAALLPAGSSHAASPAKRCTAKGAKTVAKNRYARLFTTRGRDADETGRLYGCLLSVGKRVLLAHGLDDQYAYEQTFDSVRLNRRFVAWHATQYDVSCKADCPPGYNPTTHWVFARDLRAPRSAARQGANPKGASLVLGRRGTPAWLQDAGPGTVEVRSWTGVLDSGAIDSLTLVGATLSWANAGSPKSARLDP